VKNIANLKNSINISAKLDYNVYDPFASAKPILIKKEKDFLKKIPISDVIKIQTILNKKVLIKNRWFSVGDKINNNLIKHIKKDYIVVLNNKKWMKITTQRKKKLIYIKRNDK